MRIFSIVSISCSVFILSLSALAEGETAPAVDAKQEAMAEQFLLAERAYKEKNYRLFRHIKASLRNYPLYPYLEYPELINNMSLKNEDKIRVFLYEYNNSPLESKLRRQWLNYLAKHQKWNKVIEYYADTDNRHIQCLYRTAQIKTNNSVFALSNMEELWLTGKSAPTSCNFVFKEWKKSGHMSSDIVFNRIELAVYRRNIRLAKSLAVYLPANERHWLYEIEKAYYQPEQTLSRYLDKNAKYNKYEYVVIKQALLRLTRIDEDKAAEYYIQFKSSSNLCSYDCNKIEHNITYHLVNRRHDNVLDIFKQMELHNPDSIHRAIFMSMLKDDWNSALFYIDKLSREEQLSEQWLYWRARILYKLGNHREAVSIYRSLAELRNYYGFIAADHIDYPYNLESRRIELSQSDYQLILSVPGIKRARALIDIGRLAQARREWMYAVDGFTDDQLYIAANLANKWLWHDRAIYTIANTSYTDDLDIRFPMPFKNLISVNSEENDIDPAWVYALIRQESIFMHDARSGSGALGLMQLMPATARQSASRMKKRVRGRYEIIQPHNNISLGTYYLKRIYNRFDKNMVLATAAYNAGPTNVKRWLPETETDWDIWVETIPFNETRNYVQNVASFRVIYSNKLGIHQFRLNRDLPAIPPRQQ